MSWEFLTKACQLFKLISLTYYLHENSPGQNISLRYAINILYAFSSYTPVEQGLWLQ